MPSLPHMTSVYLVSKLLCVCLMLGKKENCISSLGTTLISMINMHKKLNLPYLNGVPEGPQTVSLRLRRSSEDLSSHCSVPAGLQPALIQSSCTHQDSTDLPNGVRRPWGNPSPCPGTFEHKGREQGSVCSRLGRCTALQNRDYQLVPGSGNGHSGKLEGKTKGEKVHLSIKQIQYVLTVGLMKKSAKHLFIQ